MIAHRTSPAYPSTLGCLTLPAQVELSQNGKGWKGSSFGIARGLSQEGETEAAATLTVAHLAGAIQTPTSPYSSRAP